MEYYFSLMFIYFFLSFTNFQEIINRKLCTFILLLPIFFLVAFRDNSIGTDTYSYFITYNSISYVDNFLDIFKLSRMESLYLILNYLCNLFGLSYYGFQFIVSSIVYYSFYNFINKWSDDIPISCFIIITMRFMAGSMNTTRMYLAMAILLFAIDYLNRNKITHYFIFVLLAAGFHKSALVFLIMYPIKYMGDNKRNKILLVLIGCIIAYIGQDFFVFATDTLGVYQSYLDGRYFQNENRIAMSLNFLITLLFLSVFSLYYKCFQKNENQDEIYYLLFMAMLVVLCIEIIGFGSGNTIMSRIASYFSIFYIITIPRIFDLLKHQRSRGVFLRISIILSLILTFSVVMLYRPQWYGVVPFKFWF